MPPQLNTTSLPANVRVYNAISAVTVVAGVLRPVEPQAACLQQLDHAGEMLVFAFARKDLVADDHEPELRLIHAGTVVARSFLAPSIGANGSCRDQMPR